MSKSIKYRGTTVMSGSNLFAALEAKNEKLIAELIKELDQKFRKNFDSMFSHLTNFAIGLDPTKWEHQDSQGVVKKVYGSQITVALNSPAYKHQVTVMHHQPAVVYLINQAFDIELWDRLVDDHELQLVSFQAGDRLVQLPMNPLIVKPAVD